MAATHHLQQLNRKFNFSDAASRQFDVVGALGMSAGSFGCVFTYLAVEFAQTIKDVVVQVTPKYKRQHHITQGLGRAICDQSRGRYHAAFEPGEALPLSALD